MERVIGKIHLPLFKNLQLVLFLDPKQVNELPKREENPFSFKHFLKQDPVTSTINNNNNNCTITSATSNINHSRSTSNINGHDLVNGNPSPSKSATTSSLNNSTGARPKIPQFQSVGMINNSDPKMKRSPKFSSFDSQSSLSDLADEKSNLHSSRSNNSFNLDYSPSISSLNHNQESVERSYDMDPLPRVDRKYPIQTSIIDCLIIQTRTIRICCQTLYKIIY